MCFLSLCCHLVANSPEQLRCCMWHFKEGDMFKITWKIASRPSVEWKDTSKQMAPRLPLMDRQILQPFGLDTTCAFVFEGNNIEMVGKIHRGELQSEKHLIRFLKPHPLSPQENSERQENCTVQ